MVEIKTRRLLITSGSFLFQPVYVSGAAGFLAFAQQVYSALIKESSGGAANCFISPISIYSTISLVLAGSDKVTRKEMLSTLRLEHTGSFDAAIKCAGDNVKDVFKDDNGTELIQANGMFVQSGFGLLESFIETLKVHFATSAVEVDYVKNLKGAHQTINDWILSVWKEGFIREETMDGKFSLLTGEEINVPMMHCERTLLLGHFDEELDCKAIRIPFTCHEMLILLPNAKNGINQVLSKLLETSQQDLFAKILSRSSYDISEVELRLPRFRLADSQSKDLKDVLSAMGMPSAFSIASADFSGITGRRDLFIASVFHKATIEVDEEGAEAAAATAAVMRLRCARPQVPEFIVDHPVHGSRGKSGTKTVKYRLLPPWPGVEKLYKLLPSVPDLDLNPSVIVNFLPIAAGCFVI
ncbi:Belongs to the serpin [Sparganum proliferum]